MAKRKMKMHREEGETPEMEARMHSSKFLERAAMKKRGGKKSRGKKSRGGGR